MVSPSGAGTYQIPIFAPPGPRGIKPNISLTYNSQTGLGPVGVGWSISGLSSIYRCARTYAQDNGVAAPIALADGNSGDVFCKDGNRLRLLANSTQQYGMDGSIYQTEVADFSFITAHWVSGVINGPGYFTVQGRDGLTYTYGQNGNSMVPAAGTTTAVAWYLDSIADRYGNVLATFTYTTMQGTVVPATISWSPASAASSTYNYEMVFAYSQTNNSPQGYIAGTQWQMNSELQTIYVYQSSSTLNTIRAYNLTYTSSSTTGRETLTSIQECQDSTQSNCLLPTTIGYEYGAPGIASPASTAISASATNVTPVDLNGDGRVDLAYAVASGTSYHWYVAFANASGFGSPVDTGITTADTDPILFDDFVGQGYASILAPSSGVWTLYSWNGSSFASVSANLDVDSNRVVSTRYSYASADINGDGLPDILWPASDGYFHVRLNTSQGGSPPLVPTPAQDSAIHRSQGLCGSLWETTAFQIRPSSTWTSMATDVRI
jgi:hypothetical protein